MNQYTSTSVRLGIVCLLLAGGCGQGGGGKARAVDQYVVGYKAYQRGEIETARRSMETAVLNNPDLRMARVVLGEIYRNQHNYGAAAKQYEVLARTDPYTLSNHYYLGVSYQGLARYRDSAAAYLRGLNLDPADFKSNLNLGTVYLALGDADSALRYLDKATQIDPNSAVAWSNLGVALESRGSLVLAETAFRRAVAQETDSQVVLQNLANNLLAQKKVGEAISLWRQIVQKNPTSFTRTRLAEAYTAAMDFAQAGPLLDEVLKEDPRYVPALNAKAHMLVRQYELSAFVEDDYRTQAVDYFQRSLALNGKQSKVAEQLQKWSKSSAIAP